MFDHVTRRRLASAWLGLVVVAGLGAVQTLAAPPSEEFRAVACSRFEWPNKDLNACKAYIDTLMQRLHDNNFNAVILQMRGQCDTLYPSPYEPWSDIVSPDGNTPVGWGDFDPMAYAINKAHEYGLEFHAYLNAHVCWNRATNPPAPNHIFYQHCNVNDPAHRDWLVCDSSGTPVGYSSGNEYVWIAPGIPDFQAYWRKQIMYVVEHYDGSDPVTRPRVDGVHFDRIRTNSTDWSHDPISEARRLGEANPAHLSFGDWTRDQITRTLCDLYAQINESHPYIKVSSAPLGMHSASRYTEYGYPTGDCAYGGYGYSCKYQDPQGWLAAGAQDFICPQIYWADEPWRTSDPHFSEILPDWLLHNSGRHVYAFGNVSATGPGLLSENSVTRTMAAQMGQGNVPGLVIWSYGSFNSNNYWSLFSNPGGPYEQPASVPTMPWKTNPTDGIIVGNVTDGTKPVVDAQITRSNDSTRYTALSSADGVYSFLKVSPGTYTLSFIKPGLAAQTADVTVAAGQVTRLDIVLSGPDATPPVITDVMAQGIASTQATATWYTNEMADSRVRFGTEPGNYPYEVGNTAMVLAHSVTLKNLQPGTTYYYVVLSRDQFNNAGVSPESQFTTPLTPPEFIVESRSGGLNYANYAESGSFSSSSAKSTAPGCSPSSLGSRYATSGSAKTTYSFTPSTSGSYEVFATWGESSNGATQVTHTISHANGTATIVMNQNLIAGFQNKWNSLGAYILNAGTKYTVEQTLGASQTPPRLMADAVKWAPGPVVANAGADRTIAGAWATVRVGASPTVLGGTPPYTYAWTATPSVGTSFDSPIAANPAFTAMAPGTYQVCVKVTDKNGGESTDCAAVTIASTADLLNPTGITRVAGSGSGAQLGNGNNSLAFGDVNGDGYADAIMGSPTAGGDAVPGNVSVVYGSSSIAGQSLINLATPPSGTKVTNIIGNGGMFGAAVAAGDVNGDGVDDIVIGAHQNTSSVFLPGEVYVVYGQTDFSSKNVISMSAPGSVKITRIAGDKWTPRVALGSSVAAGDLNADGCADVIIGAPLAGQSGRDGAGIAYVLYGSPIASSVGTVDLSNPPGTYGESRILGGKAGSRLGSALACGDVNGDGYEDLVLGAPGASPSGRVGAGTAFVIYSSAAMATSTVTSPSIIDLNLPAGQNGETRILGADSGDQYGCAVAVGDMNGDGYADVMVGGYGADPPAGLDIGEAAVVYGGASLGAKSVDLAAAPPAGVKVTKVLGEYTGDQFGWSLGAGDINGDGLADLLCGASLADPPLVAPLRVDAGKAYAEYGYAGVADVAVINLNAGPSGAYLFGAQPGDRLGSAIGVGGDMNLDGVADLIVAAPQANTAAGSAYVLYGSEGAIAAQAKRHDRAGDAPKRDFGPALRCLIDFKKDTGTAGETTVTLSRTNEKVTSMPLDQIANVVWDVETTRGGDWEADITLRYLAKEVAGLNVADLTVYRADSFNGPFTPIPVIARDAARNTLTVTVANQPRNVFVLKVEHPWTVTPAVDSSTTISAGAATLPPSQTFTVAANASAGPLNLTVKKDADWVLLDKAAVSLSPILKSDTVTVTFTSDVRSLTPGEHTCTLTFQDLANPTLVETRRIVLVVRACGWTVVERAPLAATGTLATGATATGTFAPSTFVFDVTNTGEVPITYSTQKDAAWITLSPTSPLVLAPGAQTILTASINATAAAALNFGTHTCNLTFTMDCAVVTKQIVLTVGCGAAPGVTAVNPPAAQEGTSQSVTIAGSDFITGHTTVKLTKAGQPDIPATSVAVTDANTLTCTFNLTGASWGRWNVVASTCAEGVPLANGFNVTCNVPAVTSISPANAEVGKKVSVTIGGEDFIAGQTVVWLSMTGKTDIMGQNVVVTGRTQLTCDLDLPAGTTVGNWTLNVGTCAAASKANAFSVEAPTVPPQPPCVVTVASISPSFVQQGTTLTGVTITGSSFDPAAGKTTVKLRMAGQADITPTNVKVAADGKSLTCDVNAGTAPVGDRSVAVLVTGCTEGVLDNAFSVTVPCKYCPTILLAGAISATQGEMVTGLTIPGTYFVPAGTNVKLTKAGEPDIVASNVNVAAEGTSLTADVNLAGAAVGHWNVVVSTCAPATAENKFVVRPPCNTPAPDVDGDRDVDMGDFLSFQACFNGPNRSWGDPPAMPASCGCFDVDRDADLDVADFLVFQGCFNGPNRQPKCQ